MSRIGRTRACDSVMERARLMEPVDEGMPSEKEPIESSCLPTGPMLACTLTSALLSAATFKTKDGFCQRSWKEPIESRCFPSGGLLARRSNSGRRKQGRNDWVSIGVSWDACAECDCRRHASM